MSQTEQDRPSVLRAARERTRAEITRQILDAARRHLATEEASGLCLCPSTWSGRSRTSPRPPAPGDRQRAATEIIAQQLRFTDQQRKGLNAARLELAPSM
jgi:hypothetical protein